MTRFFSEKDRPPHMGFYPLEFLARTNDMPDFSNVPEMQAISFDRSDQPLSIVNAMRDYQAMMDALRGGLINKGKSEIPDDLQERSNHLKSFAYFQDVTMIGITKCTSECMLDTPVENPDIGRLANDLRTKQTKTFAAGMDVIMAELRESMDAPPTSIESHKFALVFLHEFPRDPRNDEKGCEWINDAQHARAAFLGTETANVLANYIRLLGYDARAHSPSSSDIDLNKLAVLAGLATVENGQLHNPYLGTRFGITAVTTELELNPDRPLVAWADQPKGKTHGLAWKLGKGFAKNASNREPFAKRNYQDGPHPFETLKRVDKPTTYMDEENIPRVPKRTDLFARAQFGDLGKKVEDGARNGLYVRKTAPSMAQRKLMSAFVLLQNKDQGDHVCGSTLNAQRNAQNIKATCYFLGLDAIGLSRCPEWVFYSHDAAGEEIVPTHTNAISMIVDQRYDTMDGSSGDDWISVSLSMRAYLRFSLLGGVVAEQIRNLGYSAKAHTASDSDIIQPPLLLLSGLGEVSRIGEVILNPFLGPRLKSGVITTDMPMTHDKPIDFGMQKFCDSCKKCARECPSGAITAGPKLMFNGYEIWKSDSQRCATYRITSPDGAMCGRCMKTCPWNLEGLFAEKPFRWAAMNIPKAAPLLAKLDDKLGNGGLNPVKKWWWDLEIQEDEGYRPTKNGSHARDLQPELDIKYDDQTLAVYPADQAPHPWPFPFPVDREKGIKAYQSLISAKEYQQRLKAGQTDGLFHKYQNTGKINVLHTVVQRVEQISDDVRKYELSLPDGSNLPEWKAGAHIEVVVAPGFIRQYSLTGNPADKTKYEIGVLREDRGKGASKLLHRIFTQGRKVFISHPNNHFPLIVTKGKSFFMGGGIGITPMIAMAHQAYATGMDFELHYCCTSRAGAGFLQDIQNAPWAGKVHYHFSDEGTRADLDHILADYRDGDHVYTCGPDRFMASVLESAKNGDFPEDARHLEYFVVPELPEYENQPFSVKLAKSDKTIEIPVDQSITDVLAQNGIIVDVKCSDGICGVCKCGLLNGDVEHRDFVLSNHQRETNIILCQSRAKKKNAQITIDL